MNWLKKFVTFREKSDGDVVKPFLDHMEDLRWTIIKMIVVQVVMMVISFYYRHDLMDMLRTPLYKVDPALPDQLPHQLHRIVVHVHSADGEETSTFGHQSLDRLGRAEDHDP